MTMECIIKLGGSAITVKNSLETEKLEEISTFSKVIQALGLNTRCILVHGAGSFGHFQAKEYGVALGYRANQDDVKTSKVRTGFCKTRVSVTKLNHIIVSNLVSQGINAVGISPCGRWVTDNGRVVQSETDSIRELLDGGYLPVLHGDCVVDRCRGCTILSGDTIIEILCSVFKPNRVIFLADVNGVYNKPPSDPSAQLLPVITVTQDARITLPVATTHQEHDAGGIAKKLQTAASIVAESKAFITVFVCRINSQAAENAMSQGKLLGQPGTEIKLAPQDK